MSRFRLFRGLSLMVNEWYVQHGGKQYGPLTSARLKELVAQKKITPATSVRLGTSANWVPASRVQGLFAALAPAPPPAPSAPPNAPAAAPQAPLKSAPAPRASPLADVDDGELPPLAVPPVPPPLASPLARVPIGVVVQAPKAHEVEHAVAAKILGAIGLVFGILALATCWLPILNGPLGWTGIVAGGLGLVLGAAGLAISAVQKASGLYLNVAGTSSAAVGLVMTVVLGVTLGMFTSSPPKQMVVARPAPQPVIEPPAPVAEPPREPEPEPPLQVVWTPADQAIEQGPIKATIAGVGIEMVRKEAADLSTLKKGPPEPMLKIRVTIENRAQDKIVSVPGWNGSGGGLLGGVGADLAGAAASLLGEHEKAKDLQASAAAAMAGATLVDNIGNAYRQVPSVQIFGATITTPDDASLRPGKSVTKELVFAPPLAAPTVEYLRLELAPAGFGGSEPLRFQIPKAMFAKQ